MADGTRSCCGTSWLDDCVCPPVDDASRVSFATLREANARRIGLFTDAQGRRCHKADDGSDWSPAEWLQAVVGELGELANVLKKVLRGDFPLDEAMPQIRSEFADVLIYYDIFALQYGIDLGEAVRSTFNARSRQKNLPVYINDDGRVVRVDPEYTCPICDGGPGNSNSCMCPKEI